MATTKNCNSPHWNLENFKDFLFVSPHGYPPRGYWRRGSCLA